jgi:hypothetical protein
VVSSEVVVSDVPDEVAVSTSLVRSAANKMGGASQ